MKKKILVLLGVLTMALCFSACGNNSGTNDVNNAEENTEENIDEKGDDGEEEDKEEIKEDENQSGDTQVSESGALGVLSSIWDSFDEDEKFSAIGGSMTNPVDNAPGVYGLDDSEGLTGLFYIPAEYVEDIEEAATLMHMMNSNTFTGAVVRIDDAKDLAESLKTNIEGTQWVCGCPDRLIIVINDGYVIYAFGEASIMDSFSEAIENLYPNAETVCDESLL